MSGTHYDYVIVGGGMAASAVVDGIRAVDRTGTIGILSREDYEPYSRPGLSKALWRKPDMTIADLFMSGPAVEGVTFVSGANVVRLDRDAKVVTCADGRQFGYTKLVLAMSGEATTGGIDAGERIRHYRDLDDYQAIRAIAEDGGHVVVAGDGFIGIEMAAVLADSPARVTWVFEHALPGSTRFPKEIAAHLSREFRSRGVTFVHPARIASAYEDDKTVTVTLEDGRQITADALVTGLGLALPLDWVAEAGITVDDGVRVDEHWRTNDPDIYAAGDIANVPCPIVGHRRIEHKDAALTGGEAAGRNVAGQPTTDEHIPFFYSFIFDDAYEALGITDAEGPHIVDWIEPGHSAVVYYQDAEGLLEGVLLWNLPANDDWDPKQAAEALLKVREPYAEDQLRGAIHRPW